MDLDGKHVVITEGSAGIGAGLAYEFAERGARVLVAARSDSKLRAVADRIVGDHLVADLGDAGDVDAFIPRCLDVLGHIDVLVNNAGIETSTSFATADRNEIRAPARLNFEAPMMLTRDVLPKLSVDKLVDATADAIESDRRFVRLPKRYGAYHALNNVPRRLVEAALLGVKFPPEWETAGEADEADEAEGR
jgi:NAD(P)-dependent dehydrogenase (short-subunit alcohol dehydrogenase family)